MSQNSPETPSSSNYQLVFSNALATYQQKTGKDLESDPLLTRLKSCNSPDTRGFQSCHYWHHSSLHFCAHLTNFRAKFWFMNERMRNLMSDKWLTLKPTSRENVNNGPIRDLSLSAWCRHFYHIWVSDPAQALSTRSHDTQRSPTHLAECDGKKKLSSE